MATKTFKIGLSNTDKQNMAQDVYERLLALTFPEYDTDETYSVGDFVVYNDQLYKCIGATSGAWDSTKWQLATLNDLLTDIEDAVQFVNDKANVDGNYPTMTVGLAGNLDTKIVDNDVNAYLFRPTGGLDTESGNNCKEKAIVGGSLGFNQLVQNGNFANTNNWNSTRIDFSINNNIASLTPNAQSTEDNYVGQNIPMIVGHKYLFIGNSKGHTANNYVFALFYGAANNITYIRATNADVWEEKHAMFICQTNQYNIFRMVNTSQDATKINQFKNLVLFDLTAMFGSTIADYVYSLETATPGAGVAWFKQRFNKPYYPYTAIGGFTHVQTRGKKAVGFNQCDEEFEGGEIDTSTGQNSGNAHAFRTKNYIEVDPNTVYTLSYDRDTLGGSQYLLEYDIDKNYIGVAGNSGFADGVKYHTLSDKTYYVRIFFYKSNSGWSSNIPNKDVAKVCFHYTYDHERDGEYEPHHEEIYENDPVELIGIPQKDDQGNLYFEGNRYLPDGTVEGDFKDIDLSQISFATSANGYYKTTTLSDVLRPSSDGVPAVAFSPLYKLKDRNHIDDTNDFAIDENGILYIRTTDTPSGHLIYKLATPTTDSATPYPETQWVDNWGTEERLPPLSDTRPCEIPVGHDTDYPLDLKSKLEIMANSPSADGDYVLHAESGTNTYVALGSWLVANGYIKLTDISGYDATATQVLKNVEGTLTWVTEE